MANPSGSSEVDFIKGKPKKSRQGNGKHSKPSHRRKLPRGQGK